jgi:hypothetical protein
MPPLALEEERKEAKLLKVMKDVPGGRVGVGETE